MINIKYILIIVLIILITTLLFLGYWLIKKQKYILINFFLTPQYTIDDINIKNQDPNSLWIHYQGNVFDLTKFVSQHPGGKIILNCKNKNNNIYELWELEDVKWHMASKYVLSILDKYKIGELKI
jgi:hypothetical protein